jgi:hypothetical protein
LVVAVMAVLLVDSLPAVTVQILEYFPHHHSLLYGQLAAVAVDGLMVCRVVLVVAVVVYLLVNLED